MKYTIGKKTGLKYFTYNHILSYNPCYSPDRYLPMTWKGTAIDILNNDKISFRDRLWCVLRSELLSDKTLRLFTAYLLKAIKTIPSDEKNKLIELILGEGKKRLDKRRR